MSFLLINILHFTAKISEIDADFKQITVMNVGFCVSG